MAEVRAVTTPLTSHFKLSSKQCPQSSEEEEISQVLYASAVGSLLYNIVCTRSDLAHAISILSRFISNPEKQHWKAVKWVLRYLRATARLGLVFQKLETGKLRLL